MEEKYRKLNINSNFFVSVIFPFKNCLNFLEKVGFSKKNDQYYEYTGDMELIYNAMNIMDDYLVINSKLF
jgi:hypothetical protein